MAPTRTYKIQALVLRKTKLGERDLIVTLLDASGQLVKAVAKGARKPGGSYAAKLELFNAVDLMLAKGKNLDVVADARFDAAIGLLDFGLEQSACAGVVAELLATVCQEGLEHPRIYDMAKTALSAIAAAKPADALALCAAALVKIISSAGFRPNLDTCPSCESPLDLDGRIQPMLFSVDGGGAVCDACRRSYEGMLHDPAVIVLARDMLHARFSAIVDAGVDAGSSFKVLELMKPWVEHYAGRSLRSLGYLMASGLF